jgi:hypothetical protein
VWNSHFGVQRESLLLLPGTLEVTFHTVSSFGSLTLYLGTMTSHVGRALLGVKQ